MLYLYSFSKIANDKMSPLAERLHIQMKQPIDKLYVSFIAHGSSKVTLYFLQTLRTWNGRPEDKTGRNIQKLH